MATATSINYAAIASRISKQAVTQQYGHADDAAFFDGPGGNNMDVEMRERVLTERLIVRNVVRSILAAGHVVRVYNGEEYACGHTRDLDTVMRAIMATTQDQLLVYPLNAPNTTKQSAMMGSVSLVYWNEPWLVIASNSTTVEHLLARSKALASGLEEEAAI